MICEKEPIDYWHNFGTQLKTHFNEKLHWMNIEIFEELTELLITDQIKQKISPEIKDNFIKGIAEN